MTSKNYLPFGEPSLPHKGRLFVVGFLLEMVSHRMKKESELLRRYAPRNDGPAQPATWRMVRKRSLCATFLGQPLYRY